MESPKRPEEVDIPMPGETRVQQVSQEWKRNGEQRVQVFKSARFSACQGGGGRRGRIFLFLKRDQNKQYCYFAKKY